MKDKWKAGKDSVQVFLSPEEMAILNELSEKDGVSKSEYMRLAFLSDAFLRANTKAIRLTAKRVVSKIQAKWATYEKAQGGGVET